MFKNWDFKQKSNFNKSYKKINWMIDLVTSIRSTKVDFNVPPGSFVDISISGGPGVIRSENARLNGWIYVDISDVDIGTYVRNAKKAVEQIDLPAGYSLSWSGQYEYMQRAKQRLSLVVPLTLVIILLLLFLNFRVRSPYSPIVGEAVSTEAKPA